MFAGPLAEQSVTFCLHESVGPKIAFLCFFIIIFCVLTKKNENKRKEYGNLGLKLREMNTKYDILFFYLFET